MTIAITGLSGEIGHFLIQKMSDPFWDVVDLYHTKQTKYSSVKQHQHFDLLDTEQIVSELEMIQPQVIIHMAGATHIDKCEEDRVNGEAGNVWKMNVTATSEIAKYCAKHDCHLIYLSTECVFDGKKVAYSEMDLSNPTNWYGITKAKAEQAIIDSGANFSIIRAVIAYHPLGQNTLWQKIADRVKKNGFVVMANDHWITPTYLPDIIDVISLCVQKKITGIFHVVPSNSLTPYSFAQIVSNSLGYSNDSVKSAALAGIIGEEKAKLRLVHACLKASVTEKATGLKFKAIDSVVSSL